MALKKYKLMSFECILGHVSPPVQFFTGLEGSEWINPYLTVGLALGLVSIPLTIGPYVYGKYYLNKYHAIRNI